MADAEPLPEGWSKHFSKSWQKDYWFNAKTGKQSWEPPAADAASEQPEVPAAAVGEKRKADGAPGAASQVKEHAPSPAKKPEAPAAKKPEAAAAGSEEKAKAGADEKAKAPAKKAGGLGDLGTGKLSAQALHAKKQRKAHDEERKREAKEERNNYTEWVRASLNQFKESIDPYYSFPPSDGVHRIIAKDEAEMAGFIAFSHGEEDMKTVFVFHEHTAPNELESRYLQMGGTVYELFVKRSEGETFSKYNTAFSLKDAKVVVKARAAKGGVQTSDEKDEEIESRVVASRSADDGAVSAAASRIKEDRAARSGP